MKSQIHHARSPRPDPRQTQKNRRLAWGLALFALLVFVTAILRQWTLAHG
jgi:hypothetical protein